MSATLEAQVLGALLDAEGPVLKTTAQTLLDIAGMDAGEFSDARIRSAWQIAGKLAAKKSRCDAKMVFARGRTHRLLPEESLGWLIELQQNNTLDREGFRAVVDGLRTSTRTKSTLEAVAARLREIEGGGDAGQGFASIEALCHAQAATGLTDGTGAEDVLEIGAAIDARERGEHQPILPTGIEMLDSVIGGWVPNLNVICGLPSVGKSALLGSIIEQQLRANVKVGLFGLEDGTVWLAKRLLSRDVGVPVRDLVAKPMTPEQASTFADRSAEYHQLLGNLVTYRQDSINSDELARRAVHWITNLGVSVIYLDHAGEVEHQARGAADDAYRLAVAWTYRRLRNIGRRYGVPIVVLAHTNRESAGKFGEDARPPRLNEIAESREIEGMARVALGLWAVEGEAEAMRCSVLKQTEGERNVHLKLDRLVQSALVSNAGGERFNPWAEKMQKAKAALASKAEEKAKARAEREAEKARVKAAKAESKAATKARQVGLLGEDA